MQDPETITIPIGGMTCQHCQTSVDRALRAVPGVTAVAVNLDRGEATITGSALDVPALRTAIEDIGFDAGDPV
ncbi:MAG: heavy-metal-associated domain-containing protein [Planctomycetes bacterium]|nr:heavy-metal-associated domain-containing protein [Planctomycetota bacterium]